MGTFLAFAVGLTAFLAAFYVQGQGLIFPCLMKVILIVTKMSANLRLPDWLPLLAARSLTALISGALAGIFGFVMFTAAQDAGLRTIFALIATLAVILSFPVAILFLGSGQLALAVLLMLIAYHLVISYTDKQQIVPLFGAGVALGVAGIIHAPFIPAALILAIGYPLATIREWGKFVAIQSILVFPLAFSIIAIDYLFRVHEWSGPSLKPALQPIGFYDWQWLTIGLLAFGFGWPIFRAWSEDNCWSAGLTIFVSWAVAAIFLNPGEPGSLLAVMALGIGCIVLMARITGARARVVLTLILIISWISWSKPPDIQPISQAVQNLMASREVRLFEADWATAQYIANHGPVAVDRHYDNLAVSYYLLSKGAANNLIEVQGDEGLILNKRLRLISVNEGLEPEQKLLFAQGQWRIVREENH